MFVDFLIQNALLVGLAIVSGVMLFVPGLGGRLSGVRQVGPQEAVQLFNHEDALILDVRENSEYHDGHIAKSRHVPLGKLKTELVALDKFKERAIIAVCRTGARSQSACGILKKAGFTKVHNLEGGMHAWEQAGLPRER